MAKIYGVLGIALSLGFGGCRDGNNDGSETGSGGSAGSGGGAAQTGGSAGETGGSSADGGSGGSTGGSGGATGGAGSSPDTTCQYWMASPGIRHAVAAMHGGRVVVATEVGVVANDSGSSLVEAIETTGFAVAIGDDWSAVAVRGEPGKPDYLLYRKDGAAWQQVFAPELMGRRWVTIASGASEVHVWAENGTIASFDGELWHERAAVGTYRGSLAAAGAKLFVWLKDDEELHVWDNGVATHLVEAQGPAIIGDESHIYIPTHTNSYHILEISRWTEDGFVPVAELPEGTRTAMAQGSALAIAVSGGGVYLLSEAGWQLVAERGELRAVDSNGTVLVDVGVTLEFVHPDGTSTPFTVGPEPVGPLVGTSVESLWTLSASGALLRLEGNAWRTIAGGSDVRLHTINASPSGDLYVSDQRRVYQVVDDALTPVGDHEFENLFDFEAPSASVLVAGTTTVGATPTDSEAEFYEWRGTEWEHLEDLDLVMASGYRGETIFHAESLLALGSGKLLFEHSGVSAPNDDPVGVWAVDVTSGYDGWSGLMWKTEFDAADSALHRFGAPSSPGAIAVATPYANDAAGQETYELIDDEGRITGSGFFDRKFDLNVGGVDLEHMVGVSEGKLLVRDGGAEWQEVTTLSPEALRVAHGSPWLGEDGVGYASRAGTTLCTYD